MARVNVRCLPSSIRSAAADAFILRQVHLQLGQMRKELERRVTERTAALLESEQKLKELAEQHQTLALVSPVGIFQTDREGNMVFVNPQFYVISGHPDGVPHSEWPNDIWPEDRRRVEKLWSDAISNWAPDKHASFEYRYKRGNWAQLEIRSFEKGYIGSIVRLLALLTVRVARADACSLGRPTSLTRRK